MRAQVIPLVALEQGISWRRIHRSMELPGTPTIAKPTVLVVGEDQLSVAFQIDRYWGEQEVTRRSIDSFMVVVTSQPDAGRLGWQLEPHHPRLDRLIFCSDACKILRFIARNPFNITANTGALIGIYILTRQ
jgi:hypothetical protein